MASPPLPVTKPIVRDAPMMPPMIECVVDTGQPIRVATSSHTAAPRRAAIMMNAKSIGLIATPLRSTIPLLTVSVTSPPASRAPLTSKIAATSSACFIVRVPAPTEVPKALATSLPPMLKAMKAPKMTVVMSTMRGASRPTKSKDHRVKAMRVIANSPPKARCQRRSLLRPTAGGGVWRSGARTWVIRSPSGIQSMRRCLSASMIRRSNDRQVTAKVNRRLTPIPSLTKCSCTIGRFCRVFTRCSRSGAISAGFCAAGAWVCRRSKVML